VNELTKGHRILFLPFREDGIQVIKALNWSHFVKIKIKNTRKQSLGLVPVTRFKQAIRSGPGEVNKEGGEYKAGRPRTYL